MEPIYFGIVGGTLFVIAWVYEMWEEIHLHKSLIDLKFAFMNLVGTSLILVFSYITNSSLFFYLNCSLLFFILVEIVYSLYIQNKRKKSRR